jgi:hypothetical protein
MRLSQYSRMNRKGQDSWHLLKWFPRIFTLLIIVFFCYYLFISFWTVEYDMKTARSASVHPRMLHSLSLAGESDACLKDVKAHNEVVQCSIARPNIVYLEKFSSETLRERMHYHREEQTDVIVRMVTAPLSARVTLEYQLSDDAKREKTIYVNERDFAFFNEQVQLSQNRHGYTYSTTSVTVIDDDMARYDGILRVEVIVP